VSRNPLRRVARGIASPPLMRQATREGNTLNQTEMKVTRVQEDLRYLIANVGNDRPELRQALLAADRCMDKAFALACDADGYADAVEMVS
jgi:hypothetical protein